MRRGRLSDEAPLAEVVGVLRAFLLPVLDAARRESALDARWQPGGPWLEEA